MDRCKSAHPGHASSFSDNSSEFRLTFVWLSFDFRMTFVWLSSDLLVVPLTYLWNSYDFPLTFGWLWSDFRLTSVWLSSDFGLTFVWISSEFPLNFLAIEFCCWEAHEYERHAGALNGRNPRTTSGTLIPTEPYPKFLSLWRLSPYSTRNQLGAGLFCTDFERKNILVLDRCLGR